MRVPLADGTLVATPGQPAADLIPSLLAASDVLRSGWFGAMAAEAGPATPSKSSSNPDPDRTRRTPDRMDPELHCEKA